MHLKIFKKRCSARTPFSEYNQIQEIPHGLEESELILIFSETDSAIRSLTMQCNGLVAVLLALISSSLASPYKYPEYPNVDKRTPWTSTITAYATGALKHRYPTGFTTYYSLADDSKLEHYSPWNRTVPRATTLSSKCQSTGICYEPTSNHSDPTGSTGARYTPGPLANPYAGPIRNFDAQERRIHRTTYRPSHTQEESPTSASSVTKSASKLHGVNLKIYYDFDNDKWITPTPSCTQAAKPT